MDVAHLPYVLDGCTGMGHRGSVRAGERPRRDLSPICRTGLARTAVRKRNGGDAFGSISGNTSTITVSTSSSETYRQRNSAKALPLGPERNERRLVVAMPHFRRPTSNPRPRDSRPSLYRTLSLATYDRILHWTVLRLHVTHARVTQHGKRR
jgi:hypothetical protein